MKKKPFIFWLASWYPTRLDPFPGDFIQRHAKALALYHPVHVLHIAKDEYGIITKDVFIEEKMSGGLTETIVYYHPPKTGIAAVDRFLSMRKFLKTGKRLTRKISSSAPGVLLHVHVAMRHGLLAHWARKKLGIKYVITEHWAGYDRKTYPEHLRPSKWFWVATKKIFKKASYFYPEVHSMGVLINETITAIPYKPISNSVDTNLFYRVERAMGNENAFQFIHVSTLSYQKNITGILNAIERWVTHHAGATFTFVGPAPAEIIKRVSSSALLSQVVIFTGALPYHQVAEHVRKANALLMFSRYENQPCVILEALCCGLPVISTDVGGIAEVINSSNGILVKSEQEDELYQAILRMMKEYDAFDMIKIAEAAQAAYSFETTGKQILSYYKEDMPGFFGT